MYQPILEVEENQVYFECLNNSSKRSIYYLVYMKQIVIRFGLLAACLIVLMQLGKYTLVTQRFSDEVFFSLFAVLFLGFGYVASKYMKEQNREPILSGNKNNDTIEINHKKIEQLNISKREYEVLELISQGFSNQEISKSLFISESTVKSHVSSLLSKLDAKRRTQAVKMAKEMQII